MCETCPIWLECLLMSIRQDEYYGVWGGLTEGERRTFRAHMRSEGYSEEELSQLEMDELVASVISFKRRIRHEAS